jgi:thiamine-monophosphate kinase
MNSATKKAMKHIREYREIYSLTKHSPRSRLQQNEIFETDCEVVKLNNLYLCASTDSVGEEISIRLYRDPFLWGWITVISSVSDLAVTGAQPIGLLLSTQWKFNCPKKIKTEFFRGANSALKACRLSLLGGDSGYSADHVMTSTILGVSAKKPLSRIGARAGDVIAILGKRQTGVGPCIAFRYLLKQSLKHFPESLFRPRPNPKALSDLRPLLSASIDTSDGIASCLHMIGRLNQIGFKLTWQADLIHPRALRFCKKNRIHPLMLLMSDLGDYQSLVFLRPQNLTQARTLAPELIVLGKCTRQAGKYDIVYNNICGRLPLESISDCARETSAIEALTWKLNNYFLNAFP